MEDKENSVSNRLLFMAFDRDNDGYISRTDINTVRQVIPDDKLVDQLAIDALGGKISYEQFVQRQDLDALMDILIKSDVNKRKKAEESKENSRPNIADLANSVQMSAVASLRSEIEQLTSQLEAVTLERDQLLSNQKGQNNNNKAENDQDEDIDTSEMQCQRYEERIVELHSVIAELSRQLDDQNDDVIREEDSEVDYESSFVEEDEDVFDDEDEDYSSLAFERDLENNQRQQRPPRQGQPRKAKEGSEGSSSGSNGDVMHSSRVLEVEVSILRQELTKARSEIDSLKTALVEKDAQLTQDREQHAQTVLERDSLKRQLNDLKSTVEFQEAKMDSGRRQEGEIRHKRSSSERRSLRRRRHPACDQNQDYYRNASGLQGSSTPSPLPPPSPARSDKARELQIELDRSVSRIEHLKSQNEVLTLTLDDSKSTTDRLTVLLGKLEANNTALQLALNYCDHMVESYDILIALLETESAVQNRHNSDVSLSRLLNDRKSAESVAKHVLSRLDKSFGTNRSDSGLGGAGSNYDTTNTSNGWWEDSSGYSHTTSSTSTTSSFMAENQSHQNSHGDFTKADEIRLREHISSLKMIKSSIQGSLVEIDPIHDDIPCNKDHSTTNSSSKVNCADLEQAVLQQELMASREEIADLRAKVYLLERERADQELALADRLSVEEVLRTHIEHLQEQVDVEAMAADRHYREEQLKKRVDSLLASLDKMTRSAEMRQKQSAELIEDLKRANTTLTEALEKSKRKYQLKLKKLEQQLTAKIVANEVSSEKRTLTTSPSKSSIPVRISGKTSQ